MGVARGAVSVPAGKGVELHITSEAEGDLSFLGDLLPGDLYGLSARDWDADELFRIKHLSSLRTLTLRGSRLSLSDMETLRRLRGLRELNLDEGSVIEKGGFAYLRDLTDLRRLSLGKSNVTDEDLRYLEGMTALEHLRLDRTLITDAGLRQLVRLTSLRSLNLSSTRITGEGLRRIRGALPKCQIISPFGLRAVTPTPTPQRRPIS